MTTGDIEKLFLDRRLETLAVVQGNGGMWQVGVRHGQAYTIKAAPTLAEAIHLAVGAAPSSELPSVFD